MIGAGPAGLEAAVMAAQNGLETLLLEAGPSVGGQVRRADHAISDVLGHLIEHPSALIGRFEAHLARSEVTLRTGAAVKRVHGSETLGVELASGETLGAGCVLLSTGLRRRRLGVPGEGLEETRSPRADAAQFAGQRVVVVGGGDEASDTARSLAAAGAEVTLLVRGVLRARTQFRTELGRVDVREHAQVQAFSADAVRLVSGESLPLNAFFVRIGMQPHCPDVEPSLRTHADGRLVVDQEGRTSVPGVFAAGDLVRPLGQRFIASAIGDGAIVARQVELALRG